MVAARQWIPVTYIMVRIKIAFIQAGIYLHNPGTDGAKIWS
jgi:hypothetical protein